MAVSVLNEDATQPSSNEARLLPEYGCRVQPDRRAVTRNILDLM